MDLKWGIYPWFMEHGVDLIHPDDLEAFKKVANNGKVFECTEVNDYITLRYGNKYYRVKDKLFKPVPSPKYNFEESVKIKENGERVIITDIMWHYGKRKHYYLVSIGGKNKSKRYLESEFI